MDMTDKRLADIEAMAHETVLRCSANNDCDAPATWRDPALWREGESPDDWVCDAHVSNRRKAHPIETLELGALALVAEVRELRAIIAGRTTPPTAEEAAAMKAAGLRLVRRWHAADEAGKIRPFPTAEVPRG